MVNQNWYYMKNSVQHGPVSPKELKALADAGEIIGTDLVRTESMEKWTKASSVKGLIRLAALLLPRLQVLLALHQFQHPLPRPLKKQKEAFEEQSVSDC